MAIKKPLVITAGHLEQLQVDDNLASIPTTLELVNGEAFSFQPGNPIYVSAVDTAKYANADNTITKDVLAFAIADVLATETGVFQINGLLTLTTAEWDTVTGDVGGLTAGSVYFLDDVDVARITKVAPITTGSYLVKVGIAVNSTDFEIIIGTPIKL